MFESSDNEIFTINHTTIETSWSNLKSNSNPTFQSTSSNNTINNNVSVTEERWLVFSPSLALWILKAIAMSLLISLTILGNLLVVFGVARSGRLRTPSYFLIVNLAVADLLLGVAVLPISAARELFDFQLNPILCSLWSSLDVLCCTASILSLCALAGERYLGVSRPLRRARVLGGARARAALLGAPWAAAALIALAAPLAWPGVEGDSCTVNKHLGYVIFSACGSFYIPAAAMLLLWWKVYRAAVGRSARLNGARLPNGGMRAHRGGAPVQTQSIKESSGRRSRRSSGWTSSEFEEPSIHMKILSRGRLSRSCSTPTETLALKNDSGSSKANDNPSKKCRHNSESSPPNKKNECQINCPNFEINRSGIVNYNNSNLELQEIKKPNRFEKLNCFKNNTNKGKCGKILEESSSDNQEKILKTFDEPDNGDHKECFKHVATKNKKNTIVHVVKCSKYCQNCSSNARKITKEVNDKMASACSLEFESQDVLRTLNCADQRRFSKSAKFPRRSPSCRSDSRVVMGGSMSMSKSVSSFRSKRLSWSFRHSSSIRSEQSRQGTIGSQSRAARTMALVVGGFLLCWCPFFIILPIDAACPSCDVGAAFTLAFWLGYFNSCINPFIYACSSREMRRAFRAILCRRKYSRAMSLRI